MNGNDVSIETAVMNLVKAAARPTRAQRMNMAQSNLKKANAARKAARSEVENVHKMLKKSYLAKLNKRAKKDDNDADDAEFNQADAMGKLQKAYGEIAKMGTFLKAARNGLEKLSRSGQRGQEAADPEAGVYEVPPGVKDLTPDAMSGAKPGSPGSTGVAPSYPGSEGTDPSSVYPGKFARLAKNGQVPVEILELVAENARLSGQQDALAKLPARGPRPFSFDVNKLGGTGGAGPSGGDPLIEACRKSNVNPAILGRPDSQFDLEDPQYKKAAATVTGNYLLGGSGRSIFDSSFGGAAAGTRNG